MNKPTPPQRPLDIPDYYLGMLIDFEPLSTDACKWVVYDGRSKVRCMTRQSAIAYINERRRLATTDTTRTVALARFYANKACNLLEQSARKTQHEDSILLDYLAVQFKPILVKLDNYLTTTINNEELPNLEDEREASSLDH